MTKNNANKTGFTLIELMLSMAFIGILLVTMTLAVMYVSKMYSKGITLKSINQAGREVGAAIQRDAGNLAHISNYYVPQDAPGAKSVGRLCLGAYSYIWSDPAALRDGSALEYTDASVQIVFARVEDGGGALCEYIAAESKYPDEVLQSKVKELLPNDKGDYAIHSLTAKPLPATGPGVNERLFDIEYVIGTNEEGTIDAAQTCVPPGGADNNFDFCAVNNFELIVRAG